MKTYIPIHGYDDKTYEIEEQWLENYLKKEYQLTIEGFLNEYTWDWTATIVTEAYKVGKLK